MLAQRGDEYSYLDNYFNEKDGDTEIWNGLQTITTIGQNQWSVADFIVSYDPEITPSTYPEFTIWGVLESDIYLTGTSVPNSVTEHRQYKAWDKIKSVGGLFKTAGEARDNLNKRGLLPNIVGKGANTNKIKLSPPNKLFGCKRLTNCIFT
jgi:hypothetical protein